MNKKTYLTIGGILAVAVYAIVNYLTKQGLKHIIETFK